MTVGTSLFEPIKSPIFVANPSICFGEDPWEIALFGCLKPLDFSSALQQCSPPSILGKGTLYTACNLRQPSESHTLSKLLHGLRIHTLLRVRL